MALLKHGPGSYYIRREGPGRYLTGTHRQALAFLRQPPEQTLAEAAKMRSEGLVVTPTADDGSSIERHVETYAPVDESIVFPGDWYIEPSEIKHGPAGYSYSFFDAYSRNTHSVTGRSPQEVVDRLNQTDHPITLRHIATLPKRAGAEATPRPEPASAMIAGRVLRPADMRPTDQDLEALDLERAERQQVAATPPPNAEFEEFWRNQPASMSRERARRDSAFSAWIETSAPSS